MAFTNIVYERRLQMSFTSIVYKRLLCTAPGSFTHALLGLLGMDSLRMDVLRTDALRTYPYAR